MTTFGNNKKTEMTDGNKIWYTNMTVGNIMNISPTRSFMLIIAFEQPELLCQTAADLKHGIANLKGPPTWNQNKTPTGLLVVNEIKVSLNPSLLWRPLKNPSLPKKHIELSSCPEIPALKNTTSTK